MLRNGEWGEISWKRYNHVFRTSMNEGMTAGRQGQGMNVNNKDIYRGHISIFIGTPAFIGITVSLMVATISNVLFVFVIRILVAAKFVKFVKCSFRNGFSLLLAGIQCKDQNVDANEGQMLTADLMVLVEGRLKMARDRWRDPAMERVKDIKGGEVPLSEGRGEGVEREGVRGVKSFILICQRLHSIANYKARSGRRSF